MTKAGQDTFHTIFGPDKVEVINGYVTLCVRAGKCGCCGQPLPDPVPSARVKAQPVSIKVYHEPGNGIVMVPTYGQSFKVPRKLDGESVYVGYLNENRELLFYGDWPHVVSSRLRITIESPRER